RRLVEVGQVTLGRSQASAFPVHQTHAAVSAQEQVSAIGLTMRQAPPRSVSSNRGSALVVRLQRSAHRLSMATQPRAARLTEGPKPEPRPIKVTERGLEHGAMRNSEVVTHTVNVMLPS